VEEREMVKWLNARWVAMLALACMLLSGLAACGGSEEKSSGSASTTAPSELSGTVTVWDDDYGDVRPEYTRAVDMIDANFKKLYPNVTIKQRSLPFTNFDQQLQAAFTARKGPDLVRFSLPGAYVFRWKDGLEKLNDRVTPELRKQLIGFDTLSIGFREDGDLYGLPHGLWNEVFYYNKKLFRQAGLPTDFKPKTWEEVRDAGLRLKAAGIQPFTGGGKDGYESSLWFSIAWPSVNTQQDAVELSEGRQPFTGEAVKQALAPEQMMQDAGLFEDDRYSTPEVPDGAARFRDGKGAMFLGLSATVAYYNEFIPKLGEENLGWFYAPGSSYLKLEPNTAWGLTKFSENKDAAFAYAKFTTNAESARILYEVGGILPNNKDVALRKDAPVQERELAQEMRTRPTFIGVNELIPQPVLKELWAELPQVLQGRKSSEEFQQDLQETYERNAD
jgi:ABC-type glycerol-3-phosphate transport system substrate-binding protein